MTEPTLPQDVTGSCLCGRIQYAATGPFPGFRYCHCERCQKYTGTAFTANLWVPIERFRFTKGEEDAVLFVHKEADDYARRFCRHCGGPVPKVARDGKHMLMPGGTLDVDPPTRPNKNIFWKLHAPWFVDPVALPKFDERPPTL